MATLGRIGLEELAIEKTRDWLKSYVGTVGIMVTTQGDAVVK